MYISYLSYSTTVQRVTNPETGKTQGEQLSYHDKGCAS